MALEDEVRAQTASIDRLINTLQTTPRGGSSSGGGGGSSSSGSGAGGKAEGVIASLISGLAKAGQGASTTGDQLNGLAGIIGKVSPALGAALGAAGDRVLQTTGTMQKLNDSGALVGGRMQELGVGIAGAGGNAQAFLATMETYRKNLQGVGATAGENAVNMSKFASEFQQTGLADKLRVMGLNTDQINQVAAVSLANSQYRDIADEKSRKKAVAGAEEFAAKLLYATEVTGKNTQQIMAENVARSESSDIMGEIMLGGPEMQEAYSRLQKSTMDMSPAMQSMVDEMFATGVKSEETAAKMSALGAAGVELENAARLQRNAKSEGEKKEADMAMARAKAHADEYMKSEQFIRTMQNDKTSEVGRAANQLFQENKARLAGQNIAAGRNVAEGRGGGAQLASQRQSAQTAAAINMRDMKTGERTPGSEAYETIQRKELGERAIANDAAIKGLNNFTGALDKAATKANTWLERNAPTAAGKKTPQQQEATQAPRVTRPVRLEGSPGMNELTDNLKGKWNSVLENFNPKGELIQVDGKEVVVNEKQWTKIGEAVQRNLSGDGKNIDKKQGPAINVDSILESANKKTSDIKTPGIDAKQIEGLGAGLQKSMPDISKQMGDFAKNTFNPEKMSSMGADMFKNVGTVMPDMFKKIGNVGMPDPTSLLTGLKGKVGSLTAELGTTKATKEAVAPEKETATASAIPQGVPNQDVLAGMLEKLNNGIANVGGLLQQGNDIASSTSSKMDMDNRFAI